MCVTMRRVRVQDNVSCLWVACQEGHLSVVEHLCVRGGKELLMLTNKVERMRVCAHAAFVREIF